MTTSPQLRESPDTAKYQVPGEVLESAANAVLRMIVAKSIVSANLELRMQTNILPEGLNYLMSV